MIRFFILLVVFLSCKDNAKIDWIKKILLLHLKMKKRQLAKLFMRVHRSYIVTLCKIAEISRLRIIFDRNTYIPVGESYKERFTEYIEKLM